MPYMKHIRGNVWALVVAADETDDVILFMGSREDVQEELDLFYDYEMRCT